MKAAKATMDSPQRPMEKFLPNPGLKLREQLGEVMRFKHYSPP